MKNGNVDNLNCGACEKAYINSCSRQQSVYMSAIKNTTEASRGLCLLKNQTTKSSKRTRCLPNHERPNSPPPVPRGHAFYTPYTSFTLWMHFCVCGTEKQAKWGREIGAIYRTKLQVGPHNVRPVDISGSRRGPGFRLSGSLLPMAPSLSLDSPGRSDGLPGLGGPTHWAQACRAGARRLIGLQDIIHPDHNEIQLSKLEVF